MKDKIILASKSGVRKKILDSNIKKIVSSMDTKGNPKTYQLSVNLNINLKDN